MPKGYAVVQQERKRPRPIPHHDTSPEPSITESPLQLFVTQTFSVADLDGDGLLSAEEFILFVHHLTLDGGESATDENNEDCQRLLRHLDADGDGKIKREELLTFIAQGVTLNAEELFTYAERSKAHDLMVTILESIKDELDMTSPGWSNSSSSSSVNSGGSSSSNNSNNNSSSNSSSRSNSNNNSRSNSNSAFDESLRNNNTHKVGKKGISLRMLGRLFMRASHSTANKSKKKDVERSERTTTRDGGTKDKIQASSSEESIQMLIKNAHEKIQRLEQKQRQQQKRWRRQQKVQSLEIEDLITKNKMLANIIQEQNSELRTLPGEQRERMLQGRLAMCREEISRLHCEVDILHSTKEAHEDEKEEREEEEEEEEEDKDSDDDNTDQMEPRVHHDRLTPRLAVPISSEDEQDEQDSNKSGGNRRDRYLGFSSSSSSSKLSSFGIKKRKRKRKKRTIKKIKRNSKYAYSIDPSDEIKVLQQNAAFMVSSDPELEILRKEIVDIILGSRIYKTGSGKSPNVQEKIMKIIRKSSLTKFAARELLLELEQQLPGILPFV